MALCGVQLHHRYAAPGVPRRGARAGAAERQQALVAVRRLQRAFLHRRRALPRQPLPQVRLQNSCRFAGLSDIHGRGWGVDIPASLSACAILPAAAANAGPALPAYAACYRPRFDARIAFCHIDSFVQVRTRSRHVPY